MRWMLPLSRRALNERMQKCIRLIIRRSPLISETTANIEHSPPTSPLALFPRRIYFSVRSVKNQFFLNCSLQLRRDRLDRLDRTRVFLKVVASRLRAYKRFVNGLQCRNSNWKTMPNRIRGLDLAASIFKTRVSTRARSQFIFHFRRNRRLERADRAVCSFSHRHRIRFRMGTTFGQIGFLLGLSVYRCCFIFHAFALFDLRLVEECPPCLLSDIRLCCGPQQADRIRLETKKKRGR